MSLAKNIEFLRRLPKLNALHGFGGFGRDLPPGVRSPLLETTGFGSNPGALRMLSFVPEDHQQHPPLVVEQLLPERPQEHSPEAQLRVTHSRANVHELTFCPAALKEKLLELGNRSGRLVRYEPCPPWFPT